MAVADVKLLLPSFNNESDVIGAVLLILNKFRRLFGFFDLSRTFSYLIHFFQGILVC
jgi:hypothetical protein